MVHFLNTNSLTTLGWSLLNGIWQMGLLWLVYLLLTGNHKRFSAVVRHNLAGVLSGLGFGWFLYSLTSSLFFPPDLIEWVRASVLSSYISAVIGPFLSAFSIIYLLILIVLIFRYLLGFYQMQTERKRAAQLFSEPLQLFANRISPVMGIRKPVSILLVNSVDTAQTIGFIKPLVLLPVALVSRLTMEQVETILLHELQHIRRNDYFINILMVIFRTVFFFNPFAHLFYKTVAREREHACDDEVLRWDYSAPVYAEALFTLEKFRQQPRTFSLAADGNNRRLLMERIRRVAGLPASGKKPFSPLLFFSLIAALFIFTVNSFSHFPKKDEGIQYGNQGISQNMTTFISAAVKTSGNKVTPGVQIVIKPKPEPTKKRSLIRQFKDSLPAGELENPVAFEAPARLLMQSDQEGVKDHLQYADHNEVRNFSNDKAAQPGVPVVINLEGMPYVPPVSFSFSPVGDTLISDLLLQKKMDALLALGEIKIGELQSKLNLEISLKQKGLRRMEEENRRMIRQKQKALQPALERAQLDIQRRKEEISNLMKQLQMLGGEIIVI